MKTKRAYDGTWTNYSEVRWWHNTLDKSRRQDTLFPHRKLCFFAGLPRLMKSKWYILTKPIFLLQDWRTTPHAAGKDFLRGSNAFYILLMEEILHQLISILSHYLQGFTHPRWCSISSINSIAWHFSVFSAQRQTISSLETMCWLVVEVEPMEMHSKVQLCSR